MHKCDWCEKEMEDYIGFPNGYYLAWDWTICHSCWMELNEEESDEG